MVTRGKSETDLAYAAGIIDGEGSLSIRRVRPRGHSVSPNYIGTVDVGNVDFPLIEWFKETFGGSVYNQKPSQAHYQPVKRWNVSAAMAADFLRQILPYLKVKRQQAELLIEFAENRRDFRGGPYSGPRKPITPEELAYRESMYQRMRALNARPQRLSETAPFVVVSIEDAMFYEGVKR